jgi:class III poly(R)-hydroxyalkanoic acid synthase PhaE subunit
MSQESSKIEDRDSLLFFLLNAALASWQQFTEAAPTKAPGLPGFQPTSIDPWVSACNMSQIFSQSQDAVRIPGSPFQSASLWPEIFQHMATHWWSGYFTLQRLWLEHVGQVPMGPQPSHFKRLDRDFFKKWLATYEQNWQPLLQIPQLGLTRVYQEKAARLADKFQIFQGALADFLFCLYLPVEESLMNMQEHLIAQARQGRVIDDFQVCYQMWIKTLEGYYLNLLKDPAYLRSMQGVLEALGDFLTARQELLTVTLKNLAIPTHEELDELSQEVYHLKKKVKELTKSRSRKKSTKRSPSSD